MTIVPVPSSYTRRRTVVAPCPPRRQTLGIYDSHFHKIIMTLSAILHLGDVVFENNDKGFARVKTKDTLKKVCQLLQVKDPSTAGYDAMEAGLVQQAFGVRAGGVAKSTPVDIASARERRDNLAKSIYNRLFDWLVYKIREVMDQHSTNEPRDHAIGIVDFYGFEDTEATNSLEQMLINYSAEKFQQFYNQKTFVREMAEYKEEEIQFDPVDWQGASLTAQPPDHEARTSSVGAATGPIAAYPPRRVATSCLGTLPSHRRRPPIRSSGRDRHAG